MGGEQKLVAKSGTSNSSTTTPRFFLSRTELSTQVDKQATVVKFTFVAENANVVVHLVQVLVVQQVHFRQ